MDGFVVSLIITFSAILGPSRDNPVVIRKKLEQSVAVAIRAGLHILYTGREALNADSGLGIRKNGLNMATCNRIFWSVVVPPFSLAVSYGFFLIKIETISNPFSATLVDAFSVFHKDRLMQVAILGWGG